METQHTTLKSAVDALSTLAPGARFKINGYVDSKSRTKDLHLELLPASGYTQLLRDSLEQLESWDGSRPAQCDEQQAAAFVAQQAESLRSKLEPSQDTTPADNQAKGAAYQLHAGSVYTLGDPVTEKAYVLRMRSLATAELDEPKNAKQAMNQHLQLPMHSYVHAVKLTAENFESVEIL